MKDFEKMIDEAFKNGRLLSGEELNAVNGGDNPGWTIVEEGEAVFDCHNTSSISNCSAIVPRPP